MAPNPRDDPYGIGLVAARPASGYAPVVRPPLTGTHPASLATDVVHHLLKGSRFDPNATPDLETALQPTSRGSFLDQVKGQLAPFDPRKPENWVDWAAMFVPGAKGGFKQVGPLTERQSGMLEGLQSIVGGTKFSPKKQEAMRNRLIQGGVHPDTAADMVARMTERYRNPYRANDKQLSMSDPTHPSLGDLSDLAKIMGVPRGNPIYELKRNVGQNEARAGSKLGTGTGGEVPSWVNTKDDLSLWKLYGHDPSHQAALEGMSDDQRFVLSQILDTINRRAPKADPSTSQLGSWMSGGAKGPLNARGAALHRDLHALIERMNVHAAPPYKDTVGTFVTQLRNALDQGHYEFVRKMLSSNATQWGNVAGQVHFPAMDKLDELSSHGHDPPTADPRNN